MQYESLKPELILVTVRRLAARINDRFPDSGLSRVCGELCLITQRAHERSKWIAKPVRSLRIATAITSCLIISIAVVLLYELLAYGEVDEVAPVEYPPLFEAGFNVLVLIGAAVFFLLSLEHRLKRRRALAAIHELRSIAHIIDMHQLTKDPERLLSREGFRSEISPEFKMTRFELQRYLDYCSEMLSLVGKVAAVYAQSFDDGVALASANEVESLTTGLSRKIWQKIMILHASFDDLKESNQLPEGAPPSTR